MIPFLFTKREDKNPQEQVVEFRELAEREMNAVSGASCGCSMKITMDSDIPYDH